MTKYRFIKSKLKIADELNELWDNYPLYKFMYGTEWIRKREFDICQSLTKDEATDWIEVCRVVWEQRQDIN
jgi:hypothetical protein